MPDTEFAVISSRWERPERAAAIAVGLVSVVRRSRGALGDHQRVRFHATDDNSGTGTDHMSTALAAKRS